MNKKKRDKSRQFVNKTKPKALFLRHTIKLHYLCKRYKPTQFYYSPKKHNNLWQLKKHWFC